MMLLYVAWIASWQAVFDPGLWTQASGNTRSDSRETADTRRR
jgi:hypothetical protein